MSLVKALRSTMATKQAVEVLPGDWQDALESLGFLEERLSRELARAVQGDLLEPTHVQLALEDVLEVSVT